MAIIWSPPSVHARFFRERSASSFPQRKDEAGALTSDIMPMTTDEEFASCQRSDRVLGVLLGRDLQQATLRLLLFGVALCAIVASIL
jgi:hypothetical protein